MAEKAQSSLLYSIILVSSILFSLYNKTENIPIYMDEQFHLNQTLSYYKNEFNSWNNKLTTFPGTFFVVSMLFKLLNFFNIQITEKNAIKTARLFIII